MLTHAASVTVDGRHLLDVLHPHAELKKIFVTEHGLRALLDDWVEESTDLHRGISIVSLHRKDGALLPIEELADIDAVIIDLQDVGVRYYTYFATVIRLMQTAAAAKASRR